MALADDEDTTPLSFIQAYDWLKAAGARYPGSLLESCREPYTVARLRRLWAKHIRRLEWQWRFFDEWPAHVGKRTPWPTPRVKPSSLPHITLEMLSRRPGEHWLGVGWILKDLCDEGMSLLHAQQLVLAEGRAERVRLRGRLES